MLVNLTLANILVLLKILVDRPMEASPFMVSLFPSFIASTLIFEALRQKALELQKFFSISHTQF